MTARRSFPARAFLGLAAALAFAASLLVAAPEAAAQGALRIATEGAYPPFNYVEGTEPAGFEVDLAKALCNRMGLPCTIVLQDWEGMYGGLKAGRFDAILSSMEITPERRTRYRFSRRYYRIPAALVGTRNGDDAAIVKPDDLEGRSVGVVKDSEFADYLATLPKPPVVRTYHKLDEAQLDLLTGRIDYVLGDKLALSRFLESREGMACCRVVADLPVDRGEGIGVALRRGDRGLAEMFDRAIEAVMADGTYDRIRAKYIPFDIK
ncbi:transporter substrate-binding domain-containing protein [uncultured Enterovirga sp.]|uniref:transporter substrate-binding domain-containing protein n=1 Tax=uncultured Enterovirga sp. TaxID=2026352 RepID=UPI0035C9611F